MVTISKIFKSYNLSYIMETVNYNYYTSRIKRLHPCFSDLCSYVFAGFSVSFIFRFRQKIQEEDSDQGPV